MKINLSPVRADIEQPSISKSGDVLTVNGELFDFSDIPEGATLPSDAITSDWITGEVVRESGHIILTVKLPHGASAPESTRFPQPILNVQDGQVELPSYE